MAEIVSTIATTVFDHSLGLIGRQIGYLWNYKKNVNDLKEQVENLDKEIEDKSHCVTVAGKNVERVREGVKRWKSDADKTSEEAKEILQEYEEKGKKMCLRDLCPNLLSRYQFGRRACKKRIEVERAIEEASRIQKVSDPAVGEGTGTLSTEGLFTFDSRKLVLEDIMKMLQHETKNCIGIYGFGGIGKTTFAKQVASRAAQEKMFEEIVMASVTQTVDMKEIQGQIARQLDLKLEGSTVAERAGHIYARLKGKKVLVILDDLWEKLDLKELEIPFGSEHMGCKIILTSRFRPVLASMGTEEEFCLGALKEEEAWKLFEEKTENIVRKPAYRTIGQEVAKRCEGFPVLIVTVAATLSRQPHLEAWKDALKQLKMMNSTEIEDIVKSAIESISYKHLEKPHKQLFLLCGVMRRDVSIEEVLQYSLGWGLFDEEELTIEQARSSLRTMIRSLKETCLLLDDGSQRDRNSIRMHDVVRDVAISIAKKDLNVILVGDSDVEFNTWPKEGVLRSRTGVIFRGCPNLSLVPQLLDCPSLKLLILSGSYRDSSPSIPDSFFQKANEVRVLGMSRLCFSAMPSSLSFLKNLQTLRVRKCHNLKDISIVGELKKLQTLSFAHSNIEELPSGIRQLSELRLLDLSGCSKLIKIPAGLIASLSRLEELYMKRGFDKWDVGECLNSSGSKSASLEELNGLPNLYSLEIAIPNAKLLSKLVNYDKWEKYEIIVGNMWGELSFRFWLDELEITRKFCLQLNTTNIDHLQHGVRKLIKVTECLCLGKSHGIMNVTPELDGDGFSDLKHLVIQQDNNIQYIVNVENKQEKVSFPVLESLILTKLSKLQKICNGPVMEESFSNVKVVKVLHCNSLESLFSFSMAVGLRRLQEIQVSDCRALEEIVAEKDSKDVFEHIEFAQLRKLSLKRLHKLSSFLSDGKTQREGQNSLTTHIKSEEIVSEEEEFILFEKVSFPKLEELELEGLSMLKKIWSHKISQTFRNLTNLRIGNCGSMKYLFTPFIAAALVGLQQLTIQLCSRMKQVVAKEEGETKIKTITFPQLSYLCLRYLSNLTTFFSGSVEETGPNGNLDTVIQPLFNDKVSFPKMKTLILYKIPNLTEIWSHQVHETTYSNLTKLEVEDCVNMKYLLTPSITMNLVGLQELSIRSCERMKQVLAMEGGETKMGTINLPQLSKLWLENLPNLTTFYWRSIEEMDAKENLEADVQHLFSEKVNFPSLKVLKIVNCNAIKTIWSSHETLSFPSLEKVEVYGCQTLQHVFPSSMARSLNQLEELIVQDCGVETIIGDDKDTKLEEIKTGEMPITFRFPKLINFTLSGLPKLKCFYPRESTTEWPALKQLSVFDCDKIEIFIGETKVQSSMFPLFSIEKVAFSSSMGFRNLSQMEIKCCDGLKYLFTPSIVTGLEKVQKLTIEKCSMMKSIVGDEGKAATIDTTIICEENYIESSEEMAMALVFPELTHLRLKSLPKVECFYPRKHTIEWPSLRVLDVDDCDKVSTWDFLNIPEKRGDNRFEKVISNLEFLSIRGKEMMKIMRLYGKFPLQLFRGLNSLTITEFHSEATALLPNFLGIIHGQLQTFRVYNCSFQEIFLYEGEVTDYVDGDKLRPQLGKLQLEKLPELKYICKQDQCSSFTLNVFNKLRKLYVVECPRLSNLVPSLVSFRLLYNLTISSCAGLINLIQPSTARSLEQLFELTIERCEMIEEIIGGEVRDGDEEPSSCENEISFNKLFCLTLKKLPRLTNFCSSRNYTFTFPDLAVVYVAECPNMKTFCGGITTTTQLHIVHYENKRCWEGDLNATVERIFAEMESKRLPYTIPSISSTNHSESLPQALGNQAEYLNDPRQEGQTATNQEKVADISEKGKGKEVAEPSEKSEGAPCSSDPSCSNYASQEQTAAAYHVVASSTQVEVQAPTSTVSTPSSNNEFEAGGQIYEKSPEKSTLEPRKEGQICRNDIEELGDEAEICKNSTKQGKESETCENVKEAQRLTTTQPSTSSNGQFEPEAEGHKKEGQISTHVMDELGMGTNLAASSSQPQNFPGLRVAKDFSRSLSDFLQILETQPLKNMNEEQFQSMEDSFRTLFNMNFSADLLCPYVHKARKCMERKRKVCELELKIAEAEERVHAMKEEIKEEKKVLEEEYEAITL